MAPRQNPLTLKRQQAKVGMSVALGVLVATGFMSHKDIAAAEKARTLHLCAGIALVGFSYWHWSLYQAKGQQSLHLSGGRKR